MCIILGPLEPYAIIGLILLHYGAAATEMAVSDDGELKTLFECKAKLHSFHRAVTHTRSLSRLCSVSPDFGEK